MQEQQVFALAEERNGPCKALELGANEGGDTFMTLFAQSPPDKPSASRSFKYDQF